MWIFITKRPLLCSSFAYGFRSLHTVLYGDPQYNLFYLMPAARQVPGIGIRHADQRPARQPGEDGRPENPRRLDDTAPGDRQDELRRVP